MVDITMRPPAECLPALEVAAGWRRVERLIRDGMAVDALRHRLVTGAAPADGWW